MKKLLGLLLVSLLVLGGVQAAWAVGTYTEAFRCYGKGNVCLWTISWTAHTDGSWTARSLGATAAGAKTLTALADYYLYEVEADPGSTAPTDNYDFTLTRSATGFSYDVLGGAGANHDNATTETFFPKNTGGNRFAPVGNDTYTLAITGNSISGATGVIRLWYVK